MSEQEIVSLRDQVRNLQDRLAVVERQVTDLLNLRNHESPTGYNHGSASVSGFSVASTTSVYNQLAEEIPAVSGEATRLCASLRGGSLSAAQRAQRAWSAGYWARFTLAGRISKPRPSVHCDLANTVYIVLRADGWECPVRTERASTYRGIVGDFQQPTISHGFASQAEARTYCLAAGVEYPSSSQ